jgi:hypothetical protein
MITNNNELKIAIITKPTFASPRVLSSCLAAYLRKKGFQVSIMYKIDFFKRLLDYKFVRDKYNFFAWYAYKLANYIKDRLFVDQLKSFDLIIIAETSPKCYLKDEYDFVKGKKLLKGIPIVYHGVYYLGNAPTILDIFQKQGQNGAAIFDWHLAVSAVTEIKSQPSPPWNQIGMYLESTGLKPTIKERTFAVVDFERRGREQIRNEQIQVLESLNIPYVALSGTMTIDEIREIYRKATYYFIQFPESFGLPIAECLSCGAYIFLPDSSWAMAWRLDENPGIHGPGTLADCFIVYGDKDRLKSRLEEMERGYDLEGTPKMVFDIFIKNYPSYYKGNDEQLDLFIDQLSNSLLPKDNL